MNEVKGKIWFLRGGLFAKYVFALVGLVVFVLAVNGAMETWIGYRATRTSLTDGMSREGGGDRQAHRAIDGASSSARSAGSPAPAPPYTAGAAPRRLRAAAEPGALRQPALLHLGAGPRAAPPVAPDRQLRQQCRLLPRRPLHRNADPRHQLFAGLFPRPAGPTSRSPSRIPATTPASRWPRSICASSPTISATPRSAARLCLCGRPARPGAGELDQGARDRPGSRRLCRRSRPCWRRAARAGLGQRLDRPFGADDVEPGAEIRLACVFRAADRAGALPDPRPAGAHRAVDGAWPCGRDPCRHRAGAAHADPDHRALHRRAAARRRRVRPSHRRAHQRRAGRARHAIQQHGRATAEHLCRPRGQGGGAHARSRAIHQRAEGAGGGRPRGVVLARSRRRAADGGGARAGDHACRCRADLWL